MTDQLKAMPVRPDVDSLDLRPSARALELREELVDFMHASVFPAEAEYDAYRAERDPRDGSVPPVVETLKAEAKSRGLWNLFLPSESGISQLDYAGLAEITGWSLHLAPEATNGAGAGHRQHGTAPHVRDGRAEEKDAAAVAAGRRDPLRVRDDGAGSRELGCDEHRDDDHARRR